MFRIPNSQYEAPLGHYARTFKEIYSFVNNKCCSSSFLLRPISSYRSNDWTYSKKN